MTDDHRTEGTLTDTEREQLEAFLHDNRLELVGVLDGLTDEQARRRLVPSLTTPLAIVKHATFVERVWFHVSLAGRTRAEIGLPEAEDSWVLAADDTVVSVAAAYRVAWSEAEEIAAAYDLNDLVVHNRRGPLTGPLRPGRPQRKAQPEDTPKRRKIEAAGQKPVTLDCRRFRPTKAVSSSHHGETAAARTALSRVMVPARVSTARSRFTRLLVGRADSRGGGSSGYISFF